jgi:hypothetical protein
MTRNRNHLAASGFAMAAATLMGACGAPSGQSAQETQAISQRTPKVIETLCQYNPDKTTKPNPLGMRTFVRLSSRDGDVTATYEQFPSVVSTDSAPATHALTRSLFLPGRSIASAREILLQRNDLWQELVGYKDTEGFGPVNEVLFCEDREAPVQSESSLAARPVGQQATCAYDPDSGLPNPLGMRQFVTIFDYSKDADGNKEIAFLNEHFQYLVDAHLPAAAAYTVTLSVFDTDLATARNLVLSNGSGLGTELLKENGGDVSGTILAEINASLRCK